MIEEPPRGVEDEDRVGRLLARFGNRPLGLVKAVDEGRFTMDERFQIAGKGKQQRQASSTGLRHRIRQIPWMLLAVISLVILAVLAIGGYFLNWTWTGFSGNTLWDWLSLLLLPLALTAATIWFTIMEEEVTDEVGVAEEGMAANLDRTIIDPEQTIIDRSSQ